jgi:hypothetical protein
MMNLLGAVGLVMMAWMPAPAQAQAPGKMSAQGISTPNVSNMQELAASVGAAPLEWTNGSTTPASKTLHADKDGGTSRLRLQ